jgi:hypothetical protein
MRRPLSSVVVQGMAVAGALPDGSGYDSNHQFSDTPRGRLVVGDCKSYGYVYAAETG